MRTVTGALLGGAFLLLAAFTAAQPPAGGKGGGKREDSKAGGADAFVARMMAFDKNKDGKLTKDEVTDERLHPLFDRADTNKDGVVTKEELIALYAKEGAMLGAGGRGGPPGDGPGGFGPPGGPGGPGGRGGPQPGQVLPAFLQEMLGLTDDQKKQVSEVQKMVDDKLATILTADQKKQLQEMRTRGPGGPGGPPPDGPPPQ
jgi:hypothetical protein